ncbi:MAG: class I SAM-dependent methyltransferase [Haloplanus sp.]
MTPSSDAAALTQAFYDRWTGVYDLLARRTPRLGAIRGDAAAALASRPGDVVVEFGCGTGANFPHLRERVGPGGTVVGVDFAPGMLARARRRVDAAGWANVHVVRGDATRPPVARADAVFASFLSGMLPDPAATLESWLDALAPRRVALLDLARSTGAGRPLNPLFALLVVASAPQGVRTLLRRDDSATRRLDRRVAAAHRALFDACRESRHETRAGGFVYLSAGAVRGRQDRP